MPKPMATAFAPPRPAATPAVLMAELMSGFISIAGPQMPMPR